MGPTGKLEIMEYEIKFTVNDNNEPQDIIQFINSKAAFESLWKIRRLALSALAQEINEDDEFSEEELRACLEEIIDWTHVTGMY